MFAPVVEGAKSRVTQRLCTRGTRTIHISYDDSAQDLCATKKLIDFGDQAGQNALFLSDKTGEPIMTSKANIASGRGERLGVYFGLVAFHDSVSNLHITIATSWAEQRFDLMNRRR